MIAWADQNAHSVANSESTQSASYSPGSAAENATPDLVTGVSPVEESIDIKNAPQTLAVPSESEDMAGDVDELRVSSFISTPNA